MSLINLSNLSPGNPTLPSISSTFFVVVEGKISMFLLTTSPSANRIISSDTPSGQTVVDIEWFYRPQNERVNVGSTQSYIYEYVPLLFPYLSSPFS